MLLKFTEGAWADYCYWQTQDKKTLKRINKLIKDIQRDPFTGIGKPEPLKYDYQGAWSRRIDAENRLIYMMDGDSVAFLSFKERLLLSLLKGGLFLISAKQLFQINKDLTILFSDYNLNSSKHILF